MTHTTLQAIASVQFRGKPLFNNEYAEAFLWMCTSPECGELFISGGLQCVDKYSWPLCSLSCVFNNLGGSTNTRFDAYASNFFTSRRTSRRPCRLQPVCRKDTWTPTTDDLEGILASRGLRTRAYSSPYHHFLSCPCSSTSTMNTRPPLLSHDGDLRWIRIDDARRPGSRTWVILLEERRKCRYGRGEAARLYTTVMRLFHFFNDTGHRLAFFSSGICCNLLFVTRCRQRVCYGDD
ncbi:uncharacterized protein LOC119288102 isoform X2 [Triticum dicoccoides]|nr:uncharacterized protein LOC119288102 isoform X2 [Triticum dicoccoides]